MTGGGHLNVTGVTLANGKVTGDNVSWIFLAFVLFFMVADSFIFY